MSPLILYLIKSSISIVVIYLCSALILKKESIFQFNRFFLLVSILVASLLPLLHFNLFELFSSITTKAPDYLITYQLTEVMIDEVIITASAKNNGIGLIQVISIIYFGGVIFKLSQLIVRIGQLILFASMHKKINVNGVLIILSEKDIPTFSFFRLLFINELTYNKKVVNTIISHEKVHIVQYHSIDLLLAELITVVQWFNPFIYLLKNSIKENHEFIADQKAALVHGNYASYKLLLMQQASNITTNVLAHNFSYSLLKRRLYMINKPKRPLRIGIALFGATVALGFVLFACSTPANDEQISRIEESEIETIEDAYTVVEEMPQYPGGMDSLAAFLGRNIHYPDIAKESKIQGKVIINFIIEKDGSVNKVKTTRGISKDCDEEAERVVRSMPDWIPGKQNGKLVRVSFNLPINFKLDEPDNKSSWVKVIDDTKNDSVFTVVKHMPEYPGGFEAMTSFLAKNIKYPEQAKMDSITGRVFVSFIVEKSGEVSDVSILRGIGGGCDEEALRVVSSMPKWKPGFNEDDHAVRVKFNLPIKFALN